MNDQIEQFLKFLEEEKKYADNTIAAYQNDLNQFMQFVTVQNEDIQAENSKSPIL